MKRRRRRPRIDWALRFYAEVLGLEHLHYGLWNGESLDLEGLRLAQDRYLDVLASWIPEGAETVLDVGCGTGTTAERLDSRGFEVEGLSPDPLQGEAFRERTRLPFHLTKFQQFQPRRRYDLVLMSESCQYVPLDSLFAAARRAAPGGHVLVADYFAHVKDGSRMAKSGHLLSAFLAAAGDAGYVVEREEDVTEAAMPTLDLGRELAENYLWPSLRLGAEALEYDHPWIYRLGRRLVRSRWNRLQENRVLLDSEEFRKKKCYRIFLFRDDQEGGGNDMP